MTFEDQIRDDYFEWMNDIVCSGRYSKQISYRKLLKHLHDTEFTYIIRMDENRADDGLKLRDRYVDDSRFDVMDIERALDGPCSVLEMLVALSIRCEEQYMDNPRIGDRTQQWFWGMVTNLGLGGLRDSLYDGRYVENTLNRFLNRQYEPNGKGGLFTVRNRGDLRDVEIWYQLNWYLDTIT